MAKNTDLPLVSIITPSFNQVKFIEETIKSVLNQDYPNIEHIVVDGGSTDGTLKILKEYSQFHNHFRYISEPDRGQSHAINKGLKMAKGKIIGWLNSDDTYLPEAIKKGVNALSLHPEWGMVYGRGYYINETGKILYPYGVKANNDQKSLFVDCTICQPATFIKKHVMDDLGGVDESLDFCMDYDLWIRIANKYKMGFLDDYLANARRHPLSKSIINWEEVGLPEILKTVVKYYGTVSDHWLSLYLKAHASKGEFWLLNQFKSLSISNKTSSIQIMNRFEDLWVPQSFHILIRANPKNPLRSLIIKGRNYHQFDDLSLTVLVNDQQIQNYSISERDFTLDIPIDSNSYTSIVEIISNRYIVPAELGVSSDNRPLSIIVDEVLPLSQHEYNFMKAFREEINSINK
ncbi:glycosyltransferase family 2 protein [Metabacillus sp. Hm71]|uniref:glycosyltransferase family 2 protein n=1 Tax=Metabacillus sp. Hm71 TaxID=3450743 RepID=UPI003F4414AF